jgi:hypothetical protein
VSSECKYCGETTKQGRVCTDCRRAFRPGRHHYGPPSPGRKFTLPPNCEIIYPKVGLLDRFDCGDGSFTLLRSPDGGFVIKHYPDLKPGEVNLVLR